MAYKHLKGQLKFKNQEAVDNLNRLMDQLVPNEAGVKCSRNCPWYESSFCVKYEKDTNLGDICLDEKSFIRLERG